MHVAECLCGAKTKAHAAWQCGECMCGARKGGGSRRPKSASGAAVRSASGDSGGCESARKLLAAGVTGIVATIARAAAMRSRMAGADATSSASGWDAAWWRAS